MLVRRGRSLTRVRTSSAASGRSSPVTRGLKRRPQTCLPREPLRREIFRRARRIRRLDLEKEELLLDTAACFESDTTGVPCRTAAAAPRAAAALCSRQPCVAALYRARLRAHQERRGRHARSVSYLLLSAFLLCERRRTIPSIAESFDADGCRKARREAPDEQCLPGTSASGSQPQMFSGAMFLPYSLSSAWPAPGASCENQSRCTRSARRPWNEFSKAAVPSAAPLEVCRRQEG